MVLTVPYAVACGVPLRNDFTTAADGAVATKCDLESVWEMRARGTKGVGLDVHDTRLANVDVSKYVGEGEERGEKNPRAAHQYDPHAGHSLA